MRNFNTFIVGKCELEFASVMIRMYDYCGMNNVLSSLS